MDSPPEPQLERFAHTLMITGGWPMELMSGLSVELPKESYPGEDPWTVVSGRMHEPGIGDRRTYG
jgi:hypothetical protein